MEELSYKPKAFVGRPAPEFKGLVWNGKDFKEVSLKDYIGKYVVLFFYPLDFTFVCPTEITAFSDAVNEFKSINTEVIGCSIDSHFTHKEWALKSRSEGGLAPLELPLLSDITHDISKDYGVHVDSGKDKGLALRGTFVIDTQGVLRHMSINDLNVGRNVQEIIRLIQAFQFSEKNGEVCPSKWKPGGKGMSVNNQEKLNTYWKEEHAKSD